MTVVQKKLVNYSFGQILIAKRVKKLEYFGLKTWTNSSKTFSTVEPQKLIVLVRRGDVGRAVCSRLILDDRSWGKLYGLEILACTI